MTTKATNVAKWRGKKHERWNYLKMELYRKSRRIKIGIRERKGRKRDMSGENGRELEGSCLFNGTCH